MAQYKTPGVYTTEESSYPNSITPVSTSIPLFIGYTEKADVNGESVLNIPTQISSIHEYEHYFGGAPEYTFELSELTDSNIADDILHAHTYINGKTYILEQSSEKYNLYRALQLFFMNGGGPCNILSVGNYKNPIESETLIKALNELEDNNKSSIVVIPEAIQLNQKDCTTVQNAMLMHCKTLENRFGILDVYNGYKVRDHSGQDVIKQFRSNLENEGLNFGATYYPWLNTTLVNESDLGPSLLTPESLAIVQNTPQYKQVLDSIKTQLNIMAPSSAMAGVYSRVDSERGVWKAPANVSLAGVVSPLVNINNEQQEDLNVPLNGMAVNAIRSFTGKGVLVWGARTLDGNSQDWRYINVRRTYMMLNESIKLALQDFMYEPNDKSTWVIIKSMIENFLHGQWHQGALVGSYPGDAYNVEVGLGSTMTGEDILEGKLRVNVLVAIIRPAEFIQLTFEQQMQKS